MLIHQKLKIQLNDLQIWASFPHPLPWPSHWTAYLPLCQVQCITWWSTSIAGSNQRSCLYFSANLNFLFQDQWLISGEALYSNIQWWGPGPHGPCHKGDCLVLIKVLLKNVDELLQVYHANVHPKFPDGGKMTQHLESLSSEWIFQESHWNMHLLSGISVGDTIDVRGPGGLLMYEGRGTFELKEDKKAAPKQVKVKKISECW